MSDALAKAQMLELNYQRVLFTKSFVSERNRIGSASYANNNLRFPIRTHKPKPDPMNVENRADQSSIIEQTHNRARRSYIENIKQKGIIYYWLEMISKSS